MKNTKGQMDFSRRKLMKFGAGFLGTATLASVLGINLTNSKPAIAQNELTCDQALAKLMEGNQRFIQNKRMNPHQSLEYLQSISEEQKPFAAMLGCADSRLPLEAIFDQGFGDLFVVRDAGNVATEEETGSLEFGTLVLGAKVIMVMGHYGCGAIKATLQGEEVPGTIGSILAQIEPAVKDFQGQQEDKEALKKATEANVKYQVNKLKQSSVLSELIAANQLKIVGGYFNFKTGEVTVVS
ncbi:carbonic anhydrase [Stanieria cyanosphaera PCC 7437]|uniref:carbonic anhydrase n=1 Tax=Stanieria cyanosphaera (strain ATCC 29371 / PCC 7437) TaxID=111780 RepID=K9XTN1_STAC7|nr:carbonic anhydrase [Stanieria cyanosphaera]AFZ35436.1 carbonic anhydrase [Stanieria cyanosphaera PCC 7437]